MALWLVIAVLLLAAGVVGYLLLEKRPGYGAYYGLAKLMGARLDVGPVDWTTLTRRTTPNDMLVCKVTLCPGAKPDREPKRYAMSPGALLARLKEIALVEPDTVALSCEPDCDRAARFIQYTRLMRFPDTIDVEVFTADQGSTLAIYSRSLLGRRDFGVNHARIERWLKKLDGSLSPGLSAAKPGLFR